MVLDTPVNEIVGVEIGKRGATVGVAVDIGATGDPMLAIVGVPSVAEGAGSC